MFGAIALSSSKFYWKHATRGTSGTFIHFLHQLHQSYLGKKLGIILDNGPIHRSKKALSFAKKHSSWLRIYFLPAYSPEYNPIERMWCWLKKHVYGSQSFENAAQVVKRMRKISWHYNEKRISHSIQFSFENYRKIYNYL